MAFTLEAILKLIAFGFSAYFREDSNSFDFAVILASVISSGISIASNNKFGSAITFMRALRISRIFKPMMHARQVTVIYETLIVTLPALSNVGGLLLLFLYIFSVLGVFLFAEIQLQENLNEHANFQTFGFAFLALVRCSTGEGWNFLMIDSSRPPSILF